MSSRYKTNCSMWNEGRGVKSLKCWQWFYMAGDTSSLILFQRGMRWSFLFAFWYKLACDFFPFNQCSRETVWDASAEEGFPGGQPWVVKSSGVILKGECSIFQTRSAVDVTITADPQEGISPALCPVCLSLLIGASVALQRTGERGIDVV